MYDELMHAIFLHEIHVFIFNLIQTAHTFIASIKATFNKASKFYYNNFVTDNKNQRNGRGLSNTRMICFLFVYLLVASRLHGGHMRCVALYCATQHTCAVYSEQCAQAANVILRPLHSYFGSHFLTRTYPCILAQLRVSVFYIPSWDIAN